MGVRSRPPTTVGLSGPLSGLGAALLCTSSSRVLLNGIARPAISHGQGLRQGDPLSPLLFVLAIDPLQQLLDVATSHNLLHKIQGRGSIVRVSAYRMCACLVETMGQINRATVTLYVLCIPMPRFSYV